MSHSGFAGDAALSPLSVLYYADGRTAPAFELRDQPAGGVYSNVEDLARYAIAMMDAWHGKSTAVIDADSVRLMFTPSNENLLVESNRKGLGWFTFRNSTAFAMYHAGSTGFANAALLLFPQTRDAAIDAITEAIKQLRLAKPKQLSISSRLLPSGFSVKTGLPASSAAWICP